MTVNTSAMEAERAQHIAAIGRMRRYMAAVLKLPAQRTEAAIDIFS